MATNVELQLIANILHSGDFTPIISGEIEKEMFLTDSGKSLYNFITTFKNETGGKARFPTFEIVKHRFRNTPVELPIPNDDKSMEALVHQVRQDKLRADLMRFSHELSMVAGATSEDPVPVAAEIMGRLKSALAPIQKTRHASLARDFMDVLDDYDCGNILPDGIPWPWPSLTKATKGIHPKHFYVVAGRPKSRKTFIAIAIAAYIVREFGARVLFFTPEMPPKQILLRFIATLCELHYTEFKNGELAQAEEARLLAAASKYGQLTHESDAQFGVRMSDMWGVAPLSLPCFEVVQSTNMPVTWLESQIEIHKPDLVICDSFYRQKGEGGRKHESDWKIVTAISRSLKDMAMDMGVAVLGTHQMNRDAEGKIGSMGNLSLADAVGQDADGVFRVITGKLEGQEVSALVNLGGREIPFDGVLIHNEPCNDFSEIGPLSGRKVAKKLMQEEDDGDDEDLERAKKKAKKRAADDKVQKLKKKGRRIRVPTFGKRPAEEDPTELVTEEEE